MLSVNYARPGLMARMISAAVGIRVVETKQDACPRRPFVRRLPDIAITMLVIVFSAWFFRESWVLTFEQKAVHTPLLIILAILAIITALARFCFTILRDHAITVEELHNDFPQKVVTAHHSVLHFCCFWGAALVSSGILAASVWWLVNPFFKTVSPWVLPVIGAITELIHRLHSYRKIRWLNDREESS